MTWANFYLICFLVGLVLTVVSFFSGALHLHHEPGRVHLHLPGHHASGAGKAGPVHVGGTAPSPFNLFTLLAFLTWFGGAGYLLTELGGLLALVSLALAILAGLAGGALVFWYFAKILLAHDQTLDPGDYDLVGMLGTVGVPIRAGGIGEILYSQSGSRHGCPARSEDGRAIQLGREVVVTRYERGIAYVQCWDELAGEAGLPEASSPADR